MTPAETFLQTMIDNKDRDTEIAKTLRRAKRAERKKYKKLKHAGALNGKRV